jgi:hypothetical protein
MSTLMFRRRREYIALACSLTAHHINGPAFERTWLQMRGEDLNLDPEENRESTRLITAKVKGELTNEAFEAEWFRLWAYHLDDPFIVFTERVFTEIESYESDPEVYAGLLTERHPEWYFHEESELRRRVGKLLEELFAHDAYAELRCSDESASDGTNG